MKYVRTLWIVAFGFMILANPLVSIATMCLDQLIDDFEGGIIDTYWVTNPPNCATTMISGGQLITQRPNGCSSTAFCRLDPIQFTLCGDFQVTVDFDLVEFTSIPYGSSANLYASLDINTVDSNVHIATIERYNRTTTYGYMPSTQNYKGWTTDSNDGHPGPNWAATTDLTGKMRIERIGSQIFLSYWNGGAWELLKTDACPTDDAYFQVRGGSAFSIPYDIRWDNILALGTGNVVSTDKLTWDTLKALFK